MFEWMMSATFFNGGFSCFPRFKKVVNVGKIRSSDRPSHTKYNFFSLTKGDLTPLSERDIEPTDLIYHKEKLYFWIVFSLSIISYILFSFSIIGLPILVALFFLSFLIHGIAMGQIRTNAVKISPAQFPEIYTKVEDLCKKMELKKIPGHYKYNINFGNNSMDYFYYNCLAIRNVDYPTIRFAQVFGSAYAKYSDSHSCYPH
jgi:hypothetical protein